MGTSNKPGNTIRTVNKLVAKAFGFGYRGDTYVARGDFEDGGAIWYRTRIPYEIRRRLFLPIPGVLERFPAPVGRFTQDDGSALIVIEKYAHRGIRYAQLFESATGKPADVTVVKGLDRDLDLMTFFRVAKLEVGGF